jgi:hypothetical protein
MDLVQIDVGLQIPSKDSVITTFDTYQTLEMQRDPAGMNWPS